MPDLKGNNVPNCSNHCSFSQNLTVKFTPRAVKAVILRGLNHNNKP